MKKRVISALLALCMACSLAGTAWAEGMATPETAQPAAAAAPADTTPVQETPAPAQDQATAETAQPAMPARTAQTTEPSTGVTVAVDVPEGALPADAQLTAALVGSSEDTPDAALDAVAEELENAEVEHDGFVALDISFVDANGAKVEPQQPVAVSFSLPASLLPAEADPESLAVQHLKEDETGAVEAVETVADAADVTDGTIAVDAAPAVLAAATEEAPMPQDAEITAEFEVEGFSQFVLTWTEDKVIGQDETERITFVIVDTDGHELSLPEGTNLTYHMPDSGVKTFEQIVQESGIATVTATDGVEYTFHNATLVINDGTERHPIISAERITGLTEAGNERIRFYDSVFPGETGYYTRDDGGNSGDRLELIYERKTDSEIDVYEPEPVYTKTAVTNDGGKTYDLALTVSGDVGESSQDVKLDVLFVVDQSGSMADRAIVEGQSKTYQKIVSEAAGELARNLANNDALDVRFAVVTFSDSIADTDYYDDALLRQNWTSSVEAVISATDVRSNGGTNYEAGLMAGRAAMLEARPDAMKYVIFLSDGEPTFHYTSDGDTEGGGNYTQQGQDDQAAYNQAQYYNEVNGFFTVGIGSGGSSASSYLNTLRDKVKAAVQAEVGQAGTVSDQNFAGYDAKDPSTLAEQFSQIQSQITNVTMTNVSITDALSDYVEPVAGAEPYVVVKDANGTVVETEQGNYEITNVSGNNVFTVNFKDDYALKQGYTYELHLQVQATDKAYSDFATSGYNATGEAATGTHAGQQGFYSNVQGSAKLNYTTSVRDHEEEYPMPVIQVAPNTLTITKSFVGLTQDQIDSLTGLEFTVKLAKEDIANPDEEYKLELSNFKVDGQGFTYTYSIDGIAPDTKYYVQETGGYLAGYELSISTGTSQHADGVQGEFAATDRNTEKTVAFTNTYTPSTGNLTIKKEVEGLTGGATANNTQFQFTITGPGTMFTGAETSKTFDAVNAEGAPAGSVTFTKVGDAATATVTITGEGALKINGLPLGTYTVQETSAPDIGNFYCDLPDTPVSKTISNTPETQLDQTATITNTYKPYKTLTIEKTVAGEMGSDDDAFDFTIEKTTGTLTRDDVTAVADTGVDTESIEFEDGTNGGKGKITFKLKNGGQVTLRHLKDTDVVTITETNPGNGYKLETVAMPTTGSDDGTEVFTRNQNVVTATLTNLPENASDNLGTVTFTNKRQAVAPTGLESDHNAPFALMVGAAFLAGAALLGNVVLRRRRRWQE